MPQCGRATCDGPHPRGDQGDTRRSILIRSGVQPMTTSFLRMAMAALAALMVSNAALAAPVTWYLKGVFFDGGAAAEGSFEYDAETNAYTRVNIITSGLIQDQLFNQDNESFSFNYTSSEVLKITENSQLTLAFEKPLTEAGGTVNISVYPSNPFSVFIYRKDFFNRFESKVVSGSVTTISVPVHKYRQF
jgi:hypothetical protein